MTTLQKFWYERLRTAEENGWPKFVASEDLYLDYLKLAEVCGERRRLIDAQFVKQSKTCFPLSESTRRTTAYGRAYGYVMKDLDYCRAFFQKAVGINVPW